jgi:class 3 adenylate cyclase
MTVLFTDIRGFTTHIEKLSPAGSIAFINEYLAAMEPPIREHRGFVDSYIGDAIMALFGNTADDAMRAAIGMTRNLARLNEQRRKTGRDPLRIGIGLNTGPLMLGTIGGGSQLKCGVIGDSVNLAARVESLTKSYGVTFLISEQTMTRLQDPTRYALRVVDRVRVAGKNQATTLYDVIDAEVPEQREAKLRTLGRFQEGIEAYYKADFRSALADFTECNEQGGADDIVVQRFLERSKMHLASGVPDGWTGVETLQHK